MSRCFARVMATLDVSQVIQGTEDKHGVRDHHEVTSFWDYRQKGGGRWLANLRRSPFGRGGCAISTSHLPVAFWRASVLSSSCSRQRGGPTPRRPRLRRPAW